MSVNKVVFGGQTVVDLTGDTVDASHLAQGYTAHDASGTQITGTMTGGSVWQSGIYQDEDGYICVSPNAGASGVTFANDHIVMSTV